MRREKTSSGTPEDEKMERKKICKIMVGSHLYGTNGLNSDRDFYGVFLPSRADLLAIKPYPTEVSESIKVSEGARNTSADVDCKYFALSKFMLLAAEGQPGQLELLFARDFHQVESPSEEWRFLVSQRDIFLSKRSILPFIRFAEAQAHKAVMKGENLDNIQRIVAWSKTADGKFLGRSIKEHIRDHGTIGLVPFQTFTNESGAELIEIAGRAFDVATPVKRFVEAISQLEKKYGSRSRMAASIGVDWKSIHHAMRLTYEAEDLLRDKEIRLPFDGERLVFLRQLKAGLLPEYDWSGQLHERIASLSALSELSNLKDCVDMDAVDKLHEEILGGRLK
jgi:hypothetical protein